MAEDCLKRVERVRIKIDFTKKLRVRGAATFQIQTPRVWKKVFSVKFPQFHGMLNESERYRVTANSLCLNVSFNVMVFYKCTINTIPLL